MLPKKYHLRTHSSGALGRSCSSRQGAWTRLAYFQPNGPTEPIESREVAPEKVIPADAVAATWTEASTITRHYWVA